VSEATARWCGGWADGLLTTGGDIDSLRRVIEAFYDGGGEGKPVHVQHTLSWAETEREALVNAMDQ
jgi:coenzyme F420-dependent glucose-6-phosphate dehydrogenase